MYICIDAGGVKGYFSYHILKHIRQNLGYFHIKGIIGVSVGSVLAAMYACDVLQYTSDVYIKDMLKQICDIKWPKSLKSSIKFDILYEIFKDTTLGELKIPLYIVCVTTPNGIPVVFDSTQENMKHLRIVDVVHASSSLPIIMRTVTIENVSYLDGALATGSPIALTYFIAKTKHIPEDKIQILSIGIDINTHDELEPVTTRQRLLRNVSMFSFQSISKYFTTSDTLFNKYVMSLLKNQCIRVSSQFEECNALDTSKLDKLESLAYNVFCREIHRLFTFLYPLTYPRVTNCH